MSSTSPYSKDPFHKIVDWVFSKIQKYKMELFFVTVAILLFAGCQNSIMNTLQKHIVGTLFKEIASNNILLWGGAVVFLLLCLVVFSRHIYHRYHYSSKQYFWVGFITSIYIVFRCFPPHCTQPTHWYWDFIPFSEHCSSIKYFDLWFLVPLGMGIVRLCGLFKKEKKKNQKADLLDDKEEERYYKLFRSRRIQVDFVLTQLNGLGSERSFAFGITCPWGGGKTSFLNGVKDRIQKNGWSKNDFIQREHLAEDIAEECEDLYKRNDKIKITEKDVIFVDYNPWFASGSKHVVAHFLDALQKSLSPYDGELAGSIAKYRKLLLSLNPGVFKSFVDGTVDFFSVHKDIEARFKKLEECIQRLNKKILVFMDDLDRLEANELVASLKIIRNTGSFKNVIFFVTYDKEYVLSQLASHFNFDKKDKKQGDRFLEKFFQLEVPLPQLYSSEVREYVKQLIDEKLSAVLDDNDLLKEDSVGRFFRFQNETNTELQKLYSKLNKFNPNINNAQKEISKLFELIPTIDLMLEIQSPRFWNKIVNQVSLSSKVLKSGDIDLSQLFLIIAFKQKYPLESYQIFQELLSSDGDSFMSRNSIVPYEGQYTGLGRYVNKRIYEIGNYDLKYIQYVGAFFVNNTNNSIGFYRNYLHYYNLSFPLSYVSDNEFDCFYNNPEKLWNHKNSSKEDEQGKYLSFVKKLNRTEFKSYDKRVIFEIIINAKGLFFIRGSQFKINIHQENISDDHQVLRSEQFCSDLPRIFAKIKFIPDIYKLLFLRRIILGQYEYDNGNNSKSFEQILVKLFTSNLNSLDEHLMEFYFTLSNSFYPTSKSVFPYIKLQLTKFIKIHSNLFKFLICIVRYNKISGYNENNFFSPFDVFKETDPKFLDYIKTYERYDELDVSKEKLLDVYIELVRLHNEVISVNE